MGFPLKAPRSSGARASKCGRHHAGWQSGDLQLPHRGGEVDFCAEQKEKKPLLRGLFARLCSPSATCCPFHHLPPRLACSQAQISLRTSGLIARSVSQSPAASTDQPRRSRPGRQAQWHSEQNTTGGSERQFLNPPSRVARARQQAREQPRQPRRSRPGRVPLHQTCGPLNTNPSFSALRPAAQKLTRSGLYHLFTQSASPNFFP